MTDASSGRVAGPAGPAAPAGSDPDAWPAYATEPVEVVPPDPAWAGRAAREIVALRTALAPWLVDDVHHVGSTAVPGLAAKPIIDLMAGVRSVAGAAAADDAVAGLGYELVPPGIDGRPWRRTYIKPRRARRYAHLHLVEPAHPRWAESLTFRDRLQRDAAVRRAYASLKRRLAEHHGDDREAYTEAKASFVREVLDEG